MNYWVVRAQGGRYAEDFFKGNFIAIGWNEVGDLGKRKNLDSVRDAYVKAFPDTESNVKIGLLSGQLHRFTNRIQKGDAILTPGFRKGLILVGRVNGDYEYSSKWGDACPYSHRRAMKWVAEIPRSSLPDEMKMTAWNTVFDIGQFKQVIDKWLATPSGKESRWLSGEPMRQAILDRLKERMNDDEFEKFVAALLKVLGFERTEAIGGPGDEGIDALGTLDVYGLGQVNLKVQVKHVAPDKEIGDNVVRAFRDGILQDEHGAIITTGKFHPNAVEVANDPRKKTIWLIDGEELVDLVLKHYQDFRSN